MSLGEANNHTRVLATALNGLSSLAADEGDLVSARGAKERSLGGVPILRVCLKDQIEVI